MSIITIHDSEQEGEGDNLEDGWVDLTISCKLIRVNGDLMELQHSVRLVRGWSDGTFTIGVDPHFKLSGVVLSQLLGNDMLFVSGDPNEANECLALETHLVEGVVDSLFLGDEPLVDLKSADSLLTGLVGRRVHLKEVVL